MFSYEYYTYFLLLSIFYASIYSVMTKETFQNPDSKGKRARRKMCFTLSTYTIFFLFLTWIMRLSMQQVIPTYLNLCFLKIMRQELHKKIPSVEFVCEAHCTYYFVFVHIIGVQVFDYRYYELLMDLLILYIPPYLMLTAFTYVQ